MLLLIVLVVTDFKLATALLLPEFTPFISILINLSNKNEVPTATMALLKVVAPLSPFIKSLAKEAAPETIAFAIIPPPSM